MKEREDETDAGLEILMNRAELDGVGVISVNDGHIFAFKREKVLELVAEMDRAGRDVGVIFVKHSGLTPSSPEMNS